MRDLANGVDLYRASIGFSLFHVGQGVKLDLWTGDIVNWSLDAGPEFKVTASDGLYELNLRYPTRKISRTCWKQYKGTACPYSTAGALDLVHFPNADATECDKGYDTPNGCLAHGMKRNLGLRTVPGADPAGNHDYFSLDQSGDQTGGDWRKVYYGAGPARALTARLSPIPSGSRSDNAHMKSRIFSPRNQNSTCRALPNSVILVNITLRPGENLLVLRV